MKKILLVIIIVVVLIQPVSAVTFEVPQVPDTGQMHMPESTESFGEGLWYVIQSAISKLRPEIAQAAGICLCVTAVLLLTSLLSSVSSKTKHLAEMAAIIGCAVLLLQPTNTLIQLGTNTVNEISEYSKLLVPVMTAAMAAQGGINTSTALYTGTTVFSAILTSVIARLIVPMLYIFICLCIASNTIAEDVLKKLRDFVKWVVTWSLKIILYVFTGYISITGVVSGSADASMIKAAKLTMSGSIPVVGSILSDASETILVSAGIMKNSAGVYGVLAIVAIWIGPFLKIGVQYLMLKITAAVCGVFGTKNTVALVQDFATVMGFILAMICTISLLLTIGIVCFMKGVS